jgi:predicted phosphoribosyltransferase
LDTFDTEYDFVKEVTMTAEIIENPLWRNREQLYSDRREAGQLLATYAQPYCSRDGIVLAIPAGGVPIGLEIAQALGVAFDLILIRKMPIPGNTEAGFGAISLEGDEILNSALVRQLGLTRQRIDEIKKPVMQDLQERGLYFRGRRPLPELKNKDALLVDDGLASGSSMSVAAEVVSRKKPARIIIAVPTAPAATVDSLREKADMIICPNIRAGFPFAVASAYRQWYDLDRQEAAELLEHAPWPQPGQSG